MHDHDPDLVAAVAEGTLGTSESRAAEADLRGCPRCTADLAAQRRSLEATRALRGATLTPTERTELRAAIAEAINLDLGEAPEPAPARGRRRRAIPWPSVAVAALSVMGVVALVPLIGTLTTSGADDAASSVELALTTSTLANERLESLAASEAPATTTGEGTSAFDAAPAPESAAGGSDLAESAPTTAAPPPLRLERIADTELKALAESTPLISERRPFDGEACSDVASDFFDDDPDVVSVPLDLDEDGEPESLAYFSSTDELPVERFMVVDMQTCSILGELD